MTVQVTKLGSHYLLSDGRILNCLYRFRSIAKSYFRRADGVLLLYDVTYERSFINVRDWVEAVEVRRASLLEAPKETT